MSLRLSATLERDAVCATEPTGGLAWLRLRLHNADDPTWPIEVCWRLPGSGYATQFVAHRLAGSMRKGQRVTVYASGVGVSHTRRLLLINEASAVRADDNAASQRLIEEAAA